MRWNYPLMAGCTYIAFVMGIVAGDIGEVPKASEPTSWWLPIAVLFMLSIPLICGYFAGKRSCDD